MNLQLATSNPAPPHAAAAKTAPSTTGSNAPATASEGSDTMDFAALLAQSLPTGGVVPVEEVAATALAAKDEKTLTADPALLNLANLVNPAPVLDPLISRAAALAARSTRDAIPAPACKADGGMAEQLQATFPAADSTALGTPTAKPATGHAQSVPSAAQLNASSLSRDAPLAAVQFSTALKSAAASSDIQVPASLNSVDSTPLQPDRVVIIPTVPAPSSLAAPTPLRLEISTLLSAPGWDQQLGQQVVWMSKQHQQTAELRINPPDLGPVEMRLTLEQNGQQASVHFSSPHAEVRETIENAMPRLREMMADAGIALGNASVGGESLPQQATPDQNRSASPLSSATPLKTPSPAETARMHARHGNGLIDTFA